ncbi:MAG: beta-galactosidase [Acidimicrobiales bacterium]
MRTWPTDRIGFGGDYNSEQWHREVWPDDMRLMREAGVTFVTLGVFSWSWLEPTKGEYEFAWLDDLVLNHGDDDVRVAVSGHDLVTDRTVGATAPLPAGGVLVILEGRS